MRHGSRRDEYSSCVFLGRNRIVSYVVTLKNLKPYKILKSSYCQPWLSERDGRGIAYFHGDDKISSPDQG